MGLNSPNFVVVETLEGEHDIAFSSPNRSEARQEFNKIRTAGKVAKAWLHTGRGAYRFINHKAEAEVVEAKPKAKRTRKKKTEE